MNMCKVSSCDVSECAYNSDSMCRAMAITVGDSMNPRCDTYCKSSSKSCDMGCTAGVGACKTSVCSHNQGLECGATEISVGYCGDDVDCMTFKAR